MRWVTRSAAGRRCVSRCSIPRWSAGRRVLVVAAPSARGGFFPEMLPQHAAVGAAMADGMKQTPMYTSYAAVAPRPQDFPLLLDRMGEYMRQPYDWSADV